MQYKVLQYPSEHAAFTELLKQEGVSSYLEIGSKFGGSLNLISKVLPKGARIVSIDLPSVHSKPILTTCVAELVKQGFDAYLIFGDSTDKAVIKEAELLGPYDCVFIDGNHTLPYVRADWETYSKMARLMCFHDIAFRRGPEWEKSGHLSIDVPKFWNSIKDSYRHVEFKMDPSGQDNGIGVLWMQ